MENFSDIFSAETLRALFPAERADDFFEALLGDASEGAYDIRLAFKNQAANTLNFELELHERPGCCLACNLTYGLPEVFGRHPVIDIKGLVARIDSLLAGRATCTGWKLGVTRTVSKSLHTIPLAVALA